MVNANDNSCHTMATAVRVQDTQGGGSLSHLVRNGGSGQEVLRKVVC